MTLLSAYRQRKLSSKLNHPPSACRDSAGGYPLGESLPLGLEGGSKNAQALVFMFASAYAAGAFFFRDKMCFFLLFGNHLLVVL